MWVLSHVGTSGNAKSYSLANATSSLSAAQIKSITLSKSFNIIQNQINEEWQTYWTNSPLSNDLRNIKLNI